MSILHLYFSDGHVHAGEALPALPSAPGGGAPHADVLHPAISFLSVLEHASSVCQPQLWQVYPSPFSQLQWFLASGLLRTVPSAIRFRAMLNVRGAICDFEHCHAWTGALTPVDSTAVSAREPWWLSLV